MDRFKLVLNLEQGLCSLKKLFLSLQVVHSFHNLCLLRHMLESLVHNRCSELQDLIKVRNLKFAIAKHTLRIESVKTDMTD